MSCFIQDDCVQKLSFHRSAQEGVWLGSGHRAQLQHDTQLPYVRGDCCRHVDFRLSLWQNWTQVRNGEYGVTFMHLFCTPFGIFFSFFFRPNPVVRLGWMFSLERWTAMAYPVTISTNVRNASSCISVLSSWLDRSHYEVGLWRGLWKHLSCITSFSRLGSIHLNVRHHESHDISNDLVRSPDNLEDVFNALSVRGVISWNRDNNIYLFIYYVFLTYVDCYSSFLNG